MPLDSWLILLVGSGVVVDRYRVQTEKKNSAPIYYEILFPVQ